MVRTVFVLVSVLAALVAAVPHPFVIHEAINGAPEGFVHAGTPSPNTELTLRIGLVQNNILGLQDKLIEISTPSSKTYKQWLSTEEVRVRISITMLSYLIIRRFADRRVHQAHCCERRRCQGMACQQRAHLCECLRCW